MNRILLAACLCCCAAISLFAKPNIEHIEPPFWWVGMQNSHLQVVIHAKNIAQYRVSVSPISRTWLGTAQHRHDRKPQLCLYQPQHSKQYTCGKYDFGVQQR